MTEGFAGRSMPGLLFKSAVLIALLTALSGRGQLCFAQSEPKPDPAGIATGDKNSAVDAGGNSFVVTEPTDKKAPDYSTNKKNFDEYQAQAAKEPLAVKLADSVGHVRVATNFAWTLNTGYLVLFMQAGFALLTCGLVRKKNAAHLMMLNFAAYVFAALAYYAIGYAFQFGAVAINAAPTNLGGIPALNRFLIGSGGWGWLGGKGFFLTGPAYDAGSNALTLFEFVFIGNRRLYHRRRNLRANYVLGISSLRTIHRRNTLPGIRLLGMGRRVDVSAWHHDESGSRVCRFRGIHGRPRGRRILRNGACHHSWPASR